MSNTAHRNYPKPVADNDVSDDVYLLQQALDMVDGDIDALLQALSGKASTVHEHTIAQVAGLQTALEGKADLNHLHALDNLSDVSGASDAAVGWLLVKGASGWVPGSPASVVGNHEHVIANVQNLQEALDGKAPKESREFTGNPIVPTQAPGNNSTRAASTAFVQERAGKLLSTENQSVTGGVEIVEKDLGTISAGTLTLDVGDRAMQTYVNNGAHVLSPGTVKGYCSVDIIMGPTAGVITLTGWTKVLGALTYVNGHKYRCSVSVGTGGSLLSVQAMH